MNDLDLLLFAVAFLLSAAITGMMRRYARKANLLDVPNQRSSHEVATPRGGGLGIVVVFLGALLVLWLTGDIAGQTSVAIAFGGSLVAVIGFADDHGHIAAGWRFLVQLVAATATVALLGGLPPLQVGQSLLDLGIAGDILAVLIVVWFTNAFNFMDGIDGIAASEAACIGCGALFIAALTGGGAVYPLAGILAAASLGFLIWNWPPAKIFMGDVGSAFLGFVLVAMAIAASRDGAVTLWSWLILAGVFVIDATVTLAVRILKRENWLAAHRSHAYQRASRRLGSHRGVTLTVIAINIAWLLPLAWAASLVPEFGGWLTVVAWTPLVGLSIYLGAGRADNPKGR